MLIVHIPRTRQDSFARGPDLTKSAKICQKAPRLGMDPVRLRNEGSAMQAIELMVDSELCATLLGASRTAAPAYYNLMSGSDRQQTQAPGND